MINKDYLYTNIYTSIEDFHPIKGSMYIYGHSNEARSHAVNFLINTHANDICFIEIEYQGKDIVIDKQTQKEYKLRSKKSVKSLLEKYNSSTIYIDVSGLNNRVSAALLKNYITDDIDVKVVYIEPEMYKIKEFKAESVFDNDLSEKIEGIEPLPGFAHIIPDDEDVKFIALLGFEGGRFTHLYENIQPPTDKIIPIIGVPGYRIEYPFVAFWGNREPLKNTDSWQNVKYVSANSLVDVFFLLEEILLQSPKSKIKLAPIGTKPHAIGAILFAIKHPERVELVYDNPKRKNKRTEGVGLIVESNVSKLIKEN